MAKRLHRKLELQVSGRISERRTVWEPRRSSGARRGRPPLVQLRAPPLFALDCRTPAESAAARTNRSDGASAPPNPALTQISSGRVEIDRRVIRPLGVLCLQTLASETGSWLGRFAGGMLGAGTTGDLFSPALGMFPEL